MVDNKLTKSSGEHWVCSVMSRLGWAVALTRDGLERTDILAVDPQAAPRRSIEVQVKTCNGIDDRRNGWPIGEKAQTPARSDAEWFVLVALGAQASSQPRSFVVPRDHVAAAAWIQHMQWLHDPTVPARQRNTPVGGARVKIWMFADYEDRWELLREPTTVAPVLLPTQFRDLVLNHTVELPPGHPWRDRLPHLVTVLRKIEPTR